MSDWRPIETAPRDGQFVLVFGDTKRGRRATAAWWHPADGCWEVGTYVVRGREVAGLIVGNPTHWQPLPEPPESK